MTDSRGEATTGAVVLAAMAALAALVVAIVTRGAGVRRVLPLGPVGDGAPGSP